MRLVWTTPALDDLAAIRAYVEVDDDRKAKALVLGILAAAAQLPGAPALGRPGRVSGTRELVLAPLPYLVAYRATAGVVEVLRVLHTARRWPRRLH